MREDSSQVWCACPKGPEDPPENADALPVPPHRLQGRALSAAARASKRKEFRRQGAEVRADVVGRQGFAARQRQATMSARTSARPACNSASLALARPRGRPAAARWAQCPGGRASASSFKVVTHSGAGGAASQDAFNSFQAPAGSGIPRRTPRLSVEARRMRESSGLTRSFCAAAPLSESPRAPNNAFGGHRGPWSSRLRHLSWPWRVGAEGALACAGRPALSRSAAASGGPLLKHAAAAHARVQAESCSLAGGEPSSHVGREHSECSGV